MEPALIAELRRTLAPHLALPEITPASRRKTQREVNTAGCPGLTPPTCSGTLRGFLTSCPRMDKYDILRKAQTSAPNYDLDTEGIIARLQSWDERYGVELSAATSDAVTVRFVRLPRNSKTLAREIYDFCPDTVDQGFGTFTADLAAGFTQGDDEKAAQFREFIAGIDFEDPEFGLELLRRFLVASRSVTLWWD